MIAEALTSLGYSDFIVIDNSFEGIQWITEPTKKPTKKEVLDALDKLPTVEQLRLEREAKLESALNKLKSLGLTESEAKIIIGLE